MNGIFYGFGESPNITKGKLLYLAAAYEKKILVMNKMSFSYFKTITNISLCIL